MLTASLQAASLAFSSSRILLERSSASLALACRSLSSLSNHGSDLSAKNKTAVQSVVYDLFHICSCHLMWRQT